ncbi:IclR family transcriptional regulator [Agromyces bauzanensis]
MTPERTNKVLQNATLAIDALGTHGPMTAPELAVALEMPRPSAYRLMSALVHAGLAEQSADGSVILSSRWLHLGDAALRGMAPWFHSDDVLEQLRDETGLTVFLSVGRGNEAVCVRSLHGQNFQVLVLKPGGTLQFYQGAAGRGLLAFGEVDPAEYLRAAPFPAVTPHTLCTAEELAADVVRTRELGYTVSDEDVTIGVAAIGVPVLDGRGGALAALSVAGVRDQVIGHEAGLADILKSAAARIAEASLPVD